MTPTIASIALEVIDNNLDLSILADAYQDENLDPQDILLGNFDPESLFQQAIQILYKNQLEEIKNQPISVILRHLKKNKDKHYLEYLKKYHFKDDKNTWMIVKLAIDPKLYQEILGFLGQEKVVKYKNRLHRTEFQKVVQHRKNLCHLFKDYKNREKWSYIENRYYFSCAIWTFCTENLYEW